MNLKKILFITYENPFSRDNGDRIYSSNFLDTLKNLNYYVDILCYDSNIFSKNSQSRDINKHYNFNYVQFKSPSKIKFLFSTLPGMVVNRKRNSYMHLLQSYLIQNKYDFIFINHLKMVFTLEGVLKAKCKSKTIFISHNAEYLLSKNNAINSRSLLDKLIYWQDAIKTKLFEKKWLNHFNYITTISEYDQDYYDKNFEIPITKVIRPVFDFKKSNSKIKKIINEIILVGSFVWGPKKENMLEFINSKNFNKLHKNNINLTIVGNADPILVQKINSKYDGVYMTGRVKSVDDYYNKAKIAIVPEVLGGGFKLKIAEAALRKTAIFAVKGSITKCNLKKDQHFVEANDFNDLINKIIEYQNKQNEIDLMIDNAYKISKIDFSQAKIDNDILNMLSSSKT